MLQKQCDLQKENVFDYVPITFYVEMPDVSKEAAYNTSMQPFINYFHALEENKAAIKQVKQQLMQLQDMDQVIKDEGDHEAEGDSDSSPAKQEVQINDSDENEGVKSAKKEKKHPQGGSSAYSTLYKMNSSKEQYVKSTKFKQFNFEKR